jgi:predicted lipoprotein with Yx(FWY)xxD motif
MTWTTIRFALAAAVLGAAPQIALSQPASPPQIEAQQSVGFGPYLTEAGHALYMFTGDPKGRSGCYDACAQAWPPVTTPSDTSPIAGPGVDRSKLGTMGRDDGSRQVTYNGMPLYYFVKDQGAGSTAGQDVHGFGGEWYLVSPTGQKIEKRR